MKVLGVNSLEACNKLARSVEKNLVKPLGNKLARIFDDKVVTPNEYFNRDIFQPKKNEYNFQDQMIGFIASVMIMLSVGALVVNSL